MEAVFRELKVSEALQGRHRTNENDGGAGFVRLGEEEALYRWFALCEARRRRAVVVLHRVVEEVRDRESLGRSRGEGVVRR